MTTHNRTRRFGGHANHTFYCSCGRQVSGNGGKQHFKLDGHKRVRWETWSALTTESALQRTTPEDIAYNALVESETYEEFEAAVLRPPTPEGDADA